MGKLTSTFLLLFLFTLARGQNGSPLLIHFGEKWDVENQNFAICQDSDRVMLFANRKGILSFDGEEWTPVRLQTTPYAMKTNPFDRNIYVGGDNNYGFVQKDNKGIYRYRSLTGDSSGIGMITRIIFNDSMILFCGDLSVSCHRINDLSLAGRFFAKEQFPFTGTFLKGGDTFINVSGKGLHRVDADTLFPIVTGYLTERTDILFSLPYDDDRVVLGFSNGRISLFDGIKYYTYPVKDEGYIAGNILAEGISIGDSLFAFSTLGGGAVVVEKNSGTVRNIINHQNGLPDDEIFAIGNDIAGGLWLSHPFGLTRADLLLPVADLGIYPGLAGNLSSSLRYDNELYVATSEGIFYLANEMKYTEVEVLRKNETAAPSVITAEPSGEITKPLAAPAKQENTRKGIFNRIFGRKSETAPAPGATVNQAQTPVQPDPSTGSPVTIREVPAAMYRTEKIKQLKSIDYIYRKIDGVNVRCRQLVPTDNGILAATNRGLYVINKHRATALVQDRYINYIDWEPAEGKYSVAAADGYFLAGFANGKWSISIPDKSFSEPLYSILRDDNGVFWLGGDNKAYRAEPDKNTGSINYRSFNIQNSYSQRYLIDLINDSVFLFTETSVNVFDETQEAFIPMRPGGASETSEFRYPVSNIPVIITGNTLIYHKMSERILHQDLSLLKLFDNIVSVYCETDKIWIVDGNNHLFEIDCRKASSMPPETDLLVKKIRNEKGTVFDLTNIVFARGDNVINFDIVVPGYLNRNLTEYQYYIDRVMDDWSQWSTKTSYSMGIPKAGNYELRIRAKDLRGQVGEPVIVNFTIKAPFTQTTIFYITAILIVLAMVLAFVRVREKQLQEKNRILEEKVRERTAEIEAQKEEITSSIEYASRIQMAMLPVSGVFSECFSDYFIIFKPRDIVSGDFYWIGEDGENIYFTVADCTGHGVPGAFMSTLGISILNEIITHHSNLKASTFLNILRDQVKMLLHQTGKEGEAADGMDISLCVLNKNRRTLQYSGAFNPLYVFTSGELKELKADRMPIGIHYGDEASFTNHEVHIKQGDVIYLLSDGLTDQFGGPEGSKYKKAQLKQLLAGIHHRPLSEQKKLIELEFLKWKGSNEQVDDVTVIGLRV